MTTRRFLRTILALFFILSGCGYSLVHVDSEEAADVQVTEKIETDGLEDENSRYYYTTQAPSQLALTHADISKKKDYIRSVKETLMDFRHVASDTARRDNDVFIKETGREANSFVKAYVEPIINDPEAVRNLETKAEIAKLQLLSAYLYYELSGYFQAKFYLKRLSERYESDFLSSVTVDEMQMGYSTLSEAIAGLQKKITLMQVSSSGTM